MTRVLLVGLHPEAVDYTDPALPPVWMQRRFKLVLTFAFDG
jgi:hypothetical protein